MKTLLSLALLGTLSAGAAFAQQTTGARVDFEASTGPVTVQSVQPPLPNASDWARRLSVNCRFDADADIAVVLDEQGRVADDQNSREDVVARTNDGGQTRSSSSSGGLIALPAGCSVGADGSVLLRESSSPAVSPK